MTVVAPGIVSPTAPPEFEAGDMWRISFGLGASVPLMVTAHRAGSSQAFLGPAQYLTLEATRTEVMVGTKPSNARFVAIVRATIPL